MTSKDAVLEDIRAKAQALVEAIGADIFAIRGFDIVVDGLTVKAKSRHFKIEVSYWHSKDGIRVPTWMVFQNWSSAWNRSDYIEVGGLKIIDRSNPEELREEIERMVARVEAHLELHPKPLSCVDRLIAGFRR
jgi:hypothetical protein